ncbi:glycoside hydrolase 43 family protein [Aliifodinibius salicampi]|uniref:Glycoside hydrolase 43 family protein n=1 Tax=Fodinibius salicampi TaxID=1920655 RepID=A0ABT3PZS0_9BACT|nr:glycoside hydrolase 43 family protein [Fodinibius salicampi]MCW9713313.1 glycoside hydrolase 43 family protein [Fodinibius salicampi]
MNSTTSYLLKGTFLLFLILLAQTGLSQSIEPGKKTNSTTYAQNPVIWADVPDPSIIRVGDSYYMSSTTMHFNPGVPIMKSNDLVNWEIVNYVYDTLDDSDPFLLQNGQNAYGEGTWASSLRYHNGTFYLATFSNTTQQTYIFTTDDIESGSWETFTINRLFHDPSLFFDDGRAFLLYGVDDIRIVELTSDATTLKPNGVDRVLISDSKSIAGDKFYVPAEGAHIRKINGYYYVSLISWPAGDGRTQLTYRSDSLLGEYTGKVSLQDDGIAQGGLIDTPEGDWYGFLFQDHGSVGRIPQLVPVHWENNWPIFGINGEVPEQLDIQAEDDDPAGIVGSDEFDGNAGPAQYNEETSILKGLSLVWQWNHNPDSDHWSLNERPGYLRLTNAEFDTSWVDTRNTLTQRTFGPQSTGTVLMDIQHMKNGDYAGLGALQGTNGFVGVKKENGEMYLMMMKATPEEQEEIETLPLEQDKVHLRIAFNFEDMTDKAYFYYSLDGESWHQIGDMLQMEYTLDHFVGYRFALFSYATRETGGSVDFDYFRIEPGLLNEDG